MLNESIKKLVTYGMETGLVPECERNYTINLLLDLFHQDDYEEPQEEYTNVDLESTLKELLDEAVTRGIIEDSIGYRDLFDTKIMNCLMPRPAQVQQKFKEEYAKSPECATAYFYKLSQDSDYIRRYRIKKDRKWTTESHYGTMIIPLTFRNRKKTRKQLQQLKMQNRAVIQNVSFVWKTKVMQVV